MGYTCLVACIHLYTWLVACIPHEPSDMTHEEDIQTSQVSGGIHAASQVLPMK